MAEGVDYAGDHPDPVRLYAAGKRFAVRYGGAGGSWKHIDAAEARALTAAGLHIVANVEGAADGLLGGRITGAAWARQADTHFRDLGMPPGRPIYLSADFNVNQSQWPAVAAALRGAASVIGASRVGLYGGYRAIRWAAQEGAARWLWQTYAWSTWADADGITRTHWHAGNHIEQYQNHVALAGGTVDLCRSKQTDYGQWTLSSGSAGPLPIEEDDVTPEELLAFPVTSGALPFRTFADWLKGGRAADASVASLGAELRATLAGMEAREVARDAAQTELIRAVTAGQVSDEAVARLSAAVAAAAAAAGADVRDRVLAELARQEAEREAALRAALAAETG